MSLYAKLCNFFKHRDLSLIFTFLSIVVFSLVYKYKVLYDIENILNDYKLPSLDDSIDNQYEDSAVTVFSEERLADYNGIVKKKLYLVVLGTVFDVTKGAKYYKKGGSYHYFVGKDGSRALITGDFNDESDNKDNVIDLSCTDIFNLLNWKRTFLDKYDFVGVMKGRYYDKNGKDTAYNIELYDRIDQCEDDKRASKEQEHKYPPCNIAWNPDEGSKVWCTKTSGGISRDWVGVPRQLFTPGQEKPRCVCLNLNTATSIGHFKEYDNCPKTSATCTVDTN